MNRPLTSSVPPQELYMAWCWETTRAAWLERQGRHQEAAHAHRYALIYKERLENDCDLVVHQPDQ